MVRPNNEQVLDMTDRMNVSDLVTAYQLTINWDRLADNSKRSYGLLISDAINVEVTRGVIGTLLVGSITPKEADEMYLTLLREKGAHRAAHVIKVIRRVWNVGFRLGLTASNPFAKMGIGKLPDRETLWDASEVTSFINTADDMGVPSMGHLALMCYHLCQRVGDMRKLRWGDLDRSFAVFTQEKTGKAMKIPLTRPLQDRFDLISRSLSGSTPEIIISEKTNRPYDQYYYNKVAKRVMEAANLPSTHQLRDLRRSGATEMAESGCTEDELRAITGHSSRDMLSIYVRPTQKLATAGMEKRFGKMEGMAC